MRKKYAALSIGVDDRSFHEHCMRIAEHELRIGRIIEVLEEAQGDDGDAMAFWDPFNDAPPPRDWVATGNTAAEAVAVLNCQMLPDRGHVPNAETIAAMEEADAGGGKTYKSPAEFYAEISAEPEDDTPQETKKHPWDPPEALLTDAEILNYAKTSMERKKKVSMHLHVLDVILDAIEKRAER